MSSLQMTPGLAAELINTARQLSDQELDILYDEILLLLAERKMLHPTRDEACLLQIVNAPLLPMDCFKRYEQLKKRRNNKLISADEFAELIALTEQMEINHVPRIEAVVELAQLRHSTPKAIIDELGIALR
jgi:hypothetical protein